jgi:hypothetical protein
VIILVNILTLSLLYDEYGLTAISWIGAKLGFDDILLDGIIKIPCIEYADSLLILFKMHRNKNFHCFVPVNDHGDELHGFLRRNLIKI